MNEASVNLDFRKKLLEMLPEAVIIKHYDKGMIGLPDCSVTWNGKIAWLEFKLIIPTRGWDGRIPWEKIIQKAPIQHNMITRLASQSTVGGYVGWVNKTPYVEFWDPYYFVKKDFASSSQVARYLADRMAG